jgi:hypothetical protein
MKAVTLALKTLATRPKIGDDERDMVAFMALALHEVNETLDVTCRAWEKRDYWVKADQFRREWAWAATTGTKLENVVLKNEWQNLPVVMVELSKHLEKVILPKRNTLGEPWLGAYAQMREMRGLEGERVVK